MQETKPATFRGVFDLALQAIEEGLGDPFKVRELENMWAEVEQEQTLQLMRGLAVADEYHPGRFVLQIGGDHEGEALKRDGEGGYWMQLHGENARAVDTIEQAKEIMVLKVYQREHQ